MTQHSILLLVKEIIGSVSLYVIASMLTCITMYLEPILIHSNVSKCPQKRIKLSQNHEVHKQAAALANHRLFTILLAYSLTTRKVPVDSSLLCDLTWHSAQGS